MDVVSRKPRVSLGWFPTPIEEAPRLSRRFGVRVLIKRDDLTGLAIGGNKIRNLEFLLADALAKGADTVITTGGSQSNHARLTAAACLKLGLGCRLVLDRGVHPEEQGNLLLDRLFKADVVLIESEDPAVAMKAMLEMAERLRSEGKNPYVIPRGGSVPAGATGYVAFVAELLGQLETMRVAVTHLYLGTGSGGTQSGAVAGKILAEADFAIQGISVSRSAREQREKVGELAAQTLRDLGVADSRYTARLRPPQVVDEILVDDRFRGPKYGVPTEQTMEAIEIAAGDEALVLDPVYTGKMMAGLIGHAREGLIGADDTVLFLHTGGSPALFAYHHETTAALAGAS
jgi:D-cysteine desulfhydrase family pyridoxal phosphate-dependent enzyme